MWGEGLNGVCVCVSGTYAQYACTRSYTQKEGGWGNRSFDLHIIRLFGNMSEYVNEDQKIATSWNISFQYVFSFNQVKYCLYRMGEGDWSIYCLFCILEPFLYIKYDLLRKLSVTSQLLAKTHKDIHVSPSIDTIWQLLKIEAGKSIFWPDQREERRGGRGCVHTYTIAHAPGG